MNTQKSVRNMVFQCSNHIRLTDKCSWYFFVEAFFLVCIFFSSVDAFCLCFSCTRKHVHNIIFCYMIFRFVSFHFALSSFSRSFAIRTLDCVLLIALCPITCVSRLFIFRFKFWFRSLEICSRYFSFILSLLSFYKLHSYIATTQNTFIFYLYLHRFQVEAPTIFDTGTQRSDLGVRVWVWVCAVCYLAKSLTVIFCVYIVKMNGNFIFNVLGVDGVICITI